MEPDNTRYLHAKFLVHCSPDDAINCLSLHGNQKEVSDLVHNVCWKLNEPYPMVMAMVKRDITDFTGVPDTHPRRMPTLSPFSPEGPHQRPPSPAQSSYTTSSARRSRDSGVSGIVFGPTNHGEDVEERVCVLKQSHTPYRFVRASYLRKFNPPHLTSRCEAVLAQLEGFGPVHSDECVELTWRQKGHGRTHEQMFWIVDNEELCDILHAENPTHGSDEQTPRILEQSEPRRRPESGLSDGQCQPGSWHGSLRPPEHPSPAPLAEKTPRYFQAEPFVGATLARHTDPPLNLNTATSQKTATAGQPADDAGGRSTEEPQMIDLTFTFGGTRERTETLSPDDDQGVNFLSRLQSFYTEDCEGDWILDRPTLKLKLIPMTAAGPTKYSLSWSLESQKFKRNWKKTLDFCKKHQDCDEFKIQLAAK